MPRGTRCPACGLMIEGATPVEQRPDSKMQIGNILVCANCAVVSQLTPNGPHQMTDGEISQLPNALISELQVVVGAIRQMVAERGRN